MSIQLPNIIQKRKRIGRGIGRSGAKSGRGQKGQKSRAGYSRKAGFEGGQTPLYMRLPKTRGSKQWPASQVKKPFALTVERLEHFADGDVIGPGLLRRVGWTRRSEKIKLIGASKLSKKVTVRVHAATPGATAAVEAAGGKVELIQ